MTDPDTKQVDMGTRWYQAGLGRFTARDVIFGELTSPMTLNQHVYGGLNPITMWDPTGMGQCTMVHECRKSDGHGGWIAVGGNPGDPDHPEFGSSGVSGTPTPPPPEFSLEIPYDLAPHTRIDFPMQTLFDNGFMSLAWGGFYEGPGYGNVTLGYDGKGGLVLSGYGFHVEDSEFILRSLRALGNRSPDSGDFVPSGVGVNGKIGNYEISYSFRQGRMYWWMGYGEHSVTASSTGEVDTPRGTARYGFSIEATMEEGHPFPLAPFGAAIVVVTVATLKTAVCLDPQVAMCGP
jgi:RHS repeat-associated protein